MPFVLSTCGVVLAIMASAVSAAGIGCRHTAAWRPIRSARPLKRDSCASLPADCLLCFRRAPKALQIRHAGRVAVRQLSLHVPGEVSRLVPGRVGLRPRWQVRALHGAFTARVHDGRTPDEEAKREGEDPVRRNRYRADGARSVGGGAEIQRGRPGAGSAGRYGRGRRGFPGKVAGRGPVARPGRRAPIPPSTASRSARSGRRRTPSSAGAMVSRVCAPRPNIKRPYRSRTMKTTHRASSAWRAARPVCSPRSRYGSLSLPAAPQPDAS